jgi:hypothetical protein
MKKSGESRRSRERWARASHASRVGGRDYEPEPCHKQVWATLPREGCAPRSSIAAVFDWVWWEFAQRNPQLRRPRVCRETERLYPHRDLIVGEAFFALAV